MRECAYVCVCVHELVHVCVCVRGSAYVPFRVTAAALCPIQASRPGLSRAQGLLSAGGALDSAWRGCGQAGLGGTQRLPHPQQVRPLPPPIPPHQGIVLAPPHVLPLPITPGPGRSWPARPACTRACSSLLLLRGAYAFVPCSSHLYGQLVRIVRAHAWCAAPLLCLPASQVQILATYQQSAQQVALPAAPARP